MTFQKGEKRTRGLGVQHEEIGMRHSFTLTMGFNGGGAAAGSPTSSLRESRARSDQRAYEPISCFSSDSKGFRSVAFW